MEDNGSHDSGMISAGSRNSTLSHFASRILKRLGDTKEARKAFLAEAEKCDPPLDKTELRTIWHSAVKFYKTISKQPGYVKPDEYASPEWDEPIPFSNLGQHRTKPA